MEGVGSQRLPLGEKTVDFRLELVVLVDLVLDGPQIEIVPQIPRRPFEGEVPLSEKTFDGDPAVSRQFAVNIGVNVLLCNQVNFVVHTSIYTEAAMEVPFSS